MKFLPKVGLGSTGQCQ